MPNGNAIAYRVGRVLSAVHVRITGDDIDASEPRVLFQGSGLFTTWDLWGNGCDIGPDGRLLVWREAPQPPARALKVITNVAKLAADRIAAPAAR
jgi:hypothetical protein